MSARQSEENQALHIGSAEPVGGPPPAIGQTASADDGSPKFGRLLIVLVLAVMLIGAITLGAEAYYT